MKKADASFGSLIDMCNKVGWDKGISELEKIVLANENLQAYYYSEPEFVRKAQKLTKTIVAQSLTIAKLKAMKPTPHPNT